MEFLHDFWTWAYILGIGSFYVLAVYMVPAGFRDLLDLFRTLKQRSSDPESTDSEPDED